MTLFTKAYLWIRKCLGRVPYEDDLASLRARQHARNIENAVRILKNHKAGKSPVGSCLIAPDKHDPAYAYKAVALIQACQHIVTGDTGVTFAHTRHDGKVSFQFSDGARLTYLDFAHSTKFDTFLASGDSVDYYFKEVDDGSPWDEEVDVVIRLRALNSMRVARPVAPTQVQTNDVL